MALHGLIQVNSETIGAWGAVRTDTGISRPDEPYVYTFEVHYAELGGPQRKYSVSVDHAYNDGALALLIKGLQAVQDVRNRDTP